MTRIERQRAGQLAAFFLFVAVAGCGSSAPVPGSGEITAPATTRTATADADTSPTVAAEPSFDPELYVVSMVSCLRDAGWNAEVVPPGDGIAVNSVTAEQSAAYREAFDVCNARVGPAPTPAQLSEDEIRDRYQFLLEARECLIAAGFAVSDPPSEDAFVDSWPTEAWSPYLDIDQGFERAIEECPQT